MIRIDLSQDRFSDTCISKFLDIPFNLYLDIILEALIKLGPVVLKSKPFGEEFLKNQAKFLLFFLN